MTKEELLNELALKISTGEINEQDLRTRLGASSTSMVKSDEKSSSHFSITKMLYVLGAAIVVIGVAIFVGQIWVDLGSLGHIAVTLGLGLLLTGIGSMLLKTRPDQSIGSVFQAMGGLLIPGGAMVTLYEFHTGADPVWSIAITFGIIFVFYLVLNFIHRNAVLTFFAIGNGTAFVYLLVAAIIGDSVGYSNYNFYRDVYTYLTMVIGLSYLLLAYFFRRGWNEHLVTILQFFGILGFLGATFSKVDGSVLWQMVYFPIVIAGLFLSAYWKSRAILVVSTCFLIAHVSYITTEYFADSLGWPISLVILGFIFIGLGYVSININKKYIKQ